MNIIEIKDLNRYFGEGENRVHILKNVSLNIEKGDFVAIIGQSGSGKSTLMNIIGCLDTATSGSYKINGKETIELSKDQLSDLRSQKFGFIFQRYNLLSSLTAAENVALPAIYAGMSQEKRLSRAKQLLEKLGLGDKWQNKPSQLSGGQQQRVALARALVINPDVLLMDEPLSNLDAKLRVDMRQAIRDIQRRIGITTVYVTHDQEEAMTISDHIAVMNLGEIQQVGSPKELYHKPHNEFVANFIGKTNLIDAKIIKENNKTFLQIGEYKLELQEYDHVEPQDVRVSIRPEEFIKDESGVIEATVDDSVYLGSSVNYLLNTNFAERIEVTEESTFEENLKPGDVIHLTVNTSKINIFTADGTQNLLEQVK